MIFRLFVLSMILIVSSACSNKKGHPEELYTLEEFNLILDSTGATPDKTPGVSINFSEYSPGVNRINSRALMYKRLSFFVIEFESESQAREEARRLNQYFSRNWLFDRVEGEPVLEDLVISKYKAINPNRRIQRSLSK